MRAVNIDAKYYLAKPPEKCLQEAEKAKKKMYLEACLQKCRHFLPFVASVDGIMEGEAADTLKRIASHLATKWLKPYLRMCEYVNIRIVITLVQATHWRIQ